MDLSTAAALAGVGLAIHGAVLHFVISTSVRLGKLETRVNRNELDVNNLGALYRKKPNERKAA